MVKCLNVASDVMPLALQAFVLTPSLAIKKLKVKRPRVMRQNCIKCRYSYPSAEFYRKVMQPLSDDWSIGPAMRSRSLEKNKIEKSRKPHRPGLLVIPVNTPWFLLNVVICQVLFVILQEYLFSPNINCHLFCDFSTKIIRYKFTVAHFTCFLPHSAISMHVLVP